MLLEAGCLGRCLEWDRECAAETVKYFETKHDEVVADAEADTNASLARVPPIDGVLPESLCYAPKPPKQGKGAMSPAQATITVPRAFGVVRKVAPEIFAHARPI